ncbi:MAG: OmpA family protein [Myxococcales bacterium]|nr:OmpA family protein [Myxococcales bacterium]
MTFVRRFPARPDAGGDFALGTVAAWAFVAFVALSSAPAEAQVSDANLVTYSPAAGRYRVFTLQNTMVSPHFQPYGAVMFSLERESLRLDTATKDEQLVAFQSLAYVTAGIGLYDWAQVDVTMPVGLALSSGPDVKSVDIPTGPGLGDLLIQVRGKALDNTDGGWGFGGSVGVTIPTGDGQQFRGDPGVDVMVGLAADYRASRVATTLNVGGRFRTETVKFFGTELSHDLTFGLGIDYEAWANHVNFGLEFFGKTPFLAPFTDVGFLSVEMLGGTKIALWEGLSFELAVGAGVVRAEGVPLVRFISGLSWSPRVEDSDADGIHDVSDACPLLVEDEDGFQDGDGCPEADNDGDGIPDIAEPEECRLLPEDRNGVRDDDGCPDEDHDGDRLIDIVDRCPRDAEDHDSFQDEDGCPDFDNDADSILDIYDECPNRAETYNDFKDDDGCPDLTPPVGGVACSQKCKYRINAVVRFVEGSAELDDQGRSTLRRLAEEINTNDLLSTVGVSGYASNEGDRDSMDRLAERRARTVADYLLGLKVRSALLDVRGLGSTLDSAESNDGGGSRTVKFTVRFNSQCTPVDGEKCARPK